MPVDSQEALEAVVGQTFRARVEARLRPQITPELIAEHRRAPLGQHSVALQRVLNYLGAMPIDGKLITEHDGADHWFVSRLVCFPARRADRILGPFDTEGEALDAVFRRRLAEVFGVAPDER
jgi:branched-chain amino acid transport system permease protein